MNCLNLAIAAAAVMATAFALTSCGSSGGSSAGSALSIANKVSVVDTSSSGSASVKPLALGLKAIDPNSLPAGSDYNSDSTEVYVEERSAESFDIINEILCSLGQTRYGAMLNAGDYKAQIDLAQCNSKNDSASGAGQSSKNQSSGSNQPDYEYWVVNSSRADSFAPHIVKFWIHEEANSEGEPEKMIHAKLSITEAASVANPYGIFTLHFISHPSSNGTTDTSKTVFRGYLKSERDSTGKVLLKFIAEGGFDTDGDGTNDMTFSEKVTVDRSGDGSSGGGASTTSSSGAFGSESGSYTFAFDSANFLRRDSGGTDVCLSRTSFDETAWRYGLYTSAGARVNRNSGFPIKYSSGGSDYYGWIGYWGLWFPDGVSVPDGSTVYKLSYSGSGSSSTPYTVVKAGGRLKKHTRDTMTIDDIRGVPMQMFDSSSNTDFQVVWNGSALVKTATLDRDTWLWTDLSPQQALDMAALDMSELNMWSQALGGNVQIKLDGCTWDNSTGKFSCSASASSQVVVYLESMVYPTDSVPSTLACMENCPDPAALANATPYFNTGAMQNQNVPPSDPSVQYLSYAFDTSSMLLKSSGTSVAQSGANSAHSWGINSGPLFEPTSANLAQLACSWDSNSTCAWQARSNLATFYTWETGINSWNQFTALSSGGSYLSFDAPLPVKHTRTVGGVSSTYFLQYSGFGELWGIPGKCVDRDSGADTACGPDTRWIPEFSIPAGTTVLNASDSATEYLVKPLEKEQRMQSVAASNCSGLTLTSYTLPEISGYADPAVGTRPAVADAPAVIGGVLQ